MTTTTSTRRDFLKTSLLAAGTCAMGGGVAQAISPITRKGTSRLRLSLAAYGFRQYFKDYNRGSRKTSVPKEKQISMFDFIDYCADHDLDGTELTSYFFPGDAGPDYYLRIRRHALLRGIPVSGTAVGNNFARPKGKELDKEIADVKKWIDRAALMGAPHIRVFAGRATGTTDAEARNMCIGALEECCDYAGKKGIFLGLENHGGIVAEADGMLEIIKAVNSPWFGVNLDTGNFHTELPYRDLARIAPYTVNVQLKVEMRPKGRPREHTDLERIARILNYAGYQGFVALEYEAAPDPYQAIPPLIEELKELFA